MTELFVIVVIVVQFSVFAYLYGWFMGRIAMRQDFGIIEPEEVQDEVNFEEWEE